MLCPEIIIARHLSLFSFQNVTLYDNLRKLQYIFPSLFLHSPNQIGNNNTPKC